MGLESATYVNELSASNPASTDLESQGDDHLRLLKSVLQATFPSTGQPFRFPKSVAAKSANYTVVSPDDENKLIPVDCTVASYTLTLPTSPQDGFTFYTCKTDATNDLVISSGSSNIHGASSYTIRRQYELIGFRYNSSASTWHVLAPFLPFVAANVQSSAYTLKASDHGKIIAVSATSAAVTITAPSTLPDGFHCRIQKTDSSANAVTISAAATINGAGSQRLTKQFRFADIVFATSIWLSSLVTEITPVFPQGRLSLTTAVPVTSTDVTAATTIYYQAYTGGTVPVYDSSLAAFVAQTITSGEISLALVSSHTADTIYDIFAFLDPTDGTTLRLGTGPAWSTSTNGSGARGTGAGTTQLSNVQGLDTNAVSATMRNGSSTYTVAANAGTYLGSFKTTSSAGQTEDSKSIRYLFNAYNEVKRHLLRQESTASWTYASTTKRQANASTSNKVSCLVGRAKHPALFHVACACTVGATTPFAVGIGINSTTVNSAQIFGSNSFATSAGSFGGGQAEGWYEDHLAIGSHAINWLEWSDGTGITWITDAVRQGALRGEIMS